ncbi:MAG: helix-turn-helix domain-containing protein [Pseudomonadota bacterium]
MPAAPVLDVPAPVRPQACPVEDWLDFLGHRWNALILWHLRVPRRHGELAAQLPGITPKVLAERLSALARRGLVRRSVGAGFPRTVDYAVTPRGAGLLSVLDQLELWAKVPAG